MNRDVGREERDLTESYFEYLPYERILDIAKNLTPYDLISLCQTNSEFNRIICRDEGFWKIKLRQDYPNSVNLPKGGNYTNKDFYYKLTFKNLKIKVGNRYEGLDLNKQLVIHFDNTGKNYTRDIYWIQGNNKTEMYLTFSFYDEEAEKIREKLGINKLEDEDDEIKLKYKENSIFLNCAIECTINSFPIIEQQYNFEIEYNNQVLEMSYKYYNPSVESLKKSIEQIEEEYGEIYEVIYYT